MSDYSTLGSQGAKNKQTSVLIGLDRTFVLKIPVMMVKLETDMKRSKLRFAFEESLVDKKNESFAVVDASDEKEFDSIISEKDLGEFCDQVKSFVGVNTRNDELFFTVGSNSFDMVKSPGMLSDTRISITIYPSIEDSMLERVLEKASVSSHVKMIKVLCPRHCAQLKRRFPGMKVKTTTLSGRAAIAIAHTAQ